MASNLERWLIMFFLIAFISSIFSNVARAETAKSQANVNQQLVSAISSQDDWTHGTSFSINFWQRKESKDEVESKVMDAVQKALSTGANANASSSAGESAVAMAAYREYTDIVNLLLDSGADAKSVVLSRISDFRIIQLLLSHGADVNVMQPGHWSGFAWFLAAHRMDVIYAMLDRGANVNRGDEIDHIPLYIAARAGKFDVFKLLILHGADIHVNHDGIMSYAAMAKKNDDILQYLVNAGMSPNGTQHEPGNPLNCAAYYGSLDSVQFLLAHGANPNLHDRWDRTPVSQAREGATGHNELPDAIIDALHKAGATDP